MKRFLFFLIILIFPSLLWANLTLTAGNYMDLSSAGAGTDVTVTLDLTELLGSLTFGDASTDTIVWTWNRLTGTDPTITFNSGSIGFQAITLTTDLAVTEGGTGASTFTDGGILLGTGTSAIHALGVATNGQIPIGDGTTDPVLATLTGTASEIDVTNGAGTITIGLIDPLAVAKGGTGAAALTDLIALTTHTTGNYVASANTSVLTGLTGGSAGSEGAALSLALDYTATLAANPALAANIFVFGTTGLIGEGATADLIETLLTFADPTATDKTITFPDLTGTVILSGHTFTGDVTATLGAANTTALTVAADSVALTTDTSGSYVTSVATTATTSGLTGGAAASEGAALSLGLDYTATLAGNPALGASQVVFGTTGLIAEGLTADLIETLVVFADPAATDKTITFPDETGTVLTSATSLAGDVTGTSGTTVVGDDSHAHTTTTISGVDISADTNLSGDTEIVLTGDVLSIGAAITRDAEVPGLETNAAVDSEAELEAILGIGFGASKVATAGYVLVADGVDFESVVMSGDVTIASGGATVVADESHAHTTTTVSGIDISADTNLTAGTNITLTGDDLSVDDAFILNTGDIGTGVYDFGGATTFEIPNAAGNVTLAVIGQVAVDSTNKQLVVYDGVEKAVPLVHSMQFHADLASAWDVDHEWQLLDMDRGAGVFPNGIVITSWYVDCSVADPTTELNANLYYCDALASGAFPGATPVLVDVLDTTTGNSSETNMALSDLGSGIIPTAKIFYVLIDLDPTDATTVWSIVVNYYVPEG